MFDDSKRLDALEKRLNDQISAFNDWMKYLTETDKTLKETQKALSENDKKLVGWINRFEDFDKSIAKSLGDINKYFKGVEASLVKRVTALETQLKKMGK